jgi:hypothetical protein
MPGLLKGWAYETDGQTWVKVRRGHVARIKEKLASMNLTGVKVTML